MFSGGLETPSSSSSSSSSSVSASASALRDMYLSVPSKRRVFYVHAPRWIHLRHVGQGIWNIRFPVHLDIVSSKKKKKKKKQKKEIREKKKRKRRFMSFCIAAP
jgi:hypothetical protein